MNELVLKDSDFQKFSAFVYEICGINLHEGKKELLKARLGTIVRDRNFQNFEEYYDCLVRDRKGTEITTLLNFISTNLTYFFRESEHFDFLKAKITGLIEGANPSEDGILRFWSAGCSSGEEAYSLAIILSETFNGGGMKTFKILATDLSTKVLKAARAGIYDEERIKKIPYDLKRRYFQRGENRWKGYFRVKEELRRKIIFQRLNLMEKFFFKRPFKVIFCRNVMIYFDNPTKEILVNKLYQCLGQGGYLFVGHTESLTGIDHHFKYVRPSIYQRT
jgi:chemotaxis protein methyltransferase CheR